MTETRSTSHKHAGEPGQPNVMPKVAPEAPKAKRGGASKKKVKTTAEKALEDEQAAKKKAEFTGYVTVSSIANTSSNVLTQRGKENSRERFDV